MEQREKTAADLLASSPPFPLDADHWQAIVEAVGFSPRQASVVELLLRDLSVNQISLVTGLSEGTVKDYLKRAHAKVGTHGRLQLAMHVMAISHQVPRPSGGIPTPLDGIRMDGS